MSCVQAFPTVNLAFLFWDSVFAFSSVGLVSLYALEESGLGSWVVIQFKL